MPDTRELLTVAEAAKRLPMPLTEAGLRQRIVRGELKIMRFAGRIFLTEAELIRVFGEVYEPRQKTAT